jgi:integrase
VLKKFYKFVRFGNADKTTPYPVEVAWVSTTIKKNEVKEPIVITENEARMMVEAAPSIRDKALVAVAYEGGFRIGELLGLRIGDVTLDENGAKLAVQGRTGSRTVRLITSAPVLGLYLGEHPAKENPEPPSG